MSSPEKPGVIAANRFAFSSRSTANFKGLRCTLKIASLDLISGESKGGPRQKTTLESFTLTQSDLPVKSSGTQKRFVQNLRSIGTS